MPARKTEAAALAAGEIEVKTDLGRTLVYRDLTPWEVMRLNSVLGAERATNPAVIGQAIMAAGVRKINGVPRMFPHDETSLESCVNAIGFDGMKAINLHQVRDSEEAILTAAGEPQPPQD